MVEFLVIPLSLGITGIIFIAIGVYMKMRFSYKSWIPTTGTLKCFRVLNNDSQIGVYLSLAGFNIARDYSYNYQNSKPVFTYIKNGIPSEGYCEFSIAELSKQDIGKTFNIKYNPKNNRVTVEGYITDARSKRAENIGFWIFAGIGIVLLLLACWLGIVLL